jgi:uncharacterized protein YqhQ
VGVGLLAERYLSWPAWQANLLEGFVRLGLLLAYLWGIRFMPDIRRVYGYHGAEHKTINAFEAGADLDVQTIKQFPREHPRCGTAFLLTVFVFSIVLFSALGPLPVIARVVSRIVLLPVLASLAYEYIRLTARLSRYSWGRLLIAPNLWLQRLTTAEPDEQMLDVAISAFQAMRTHEEEAMQEAAAAS